MDIGSEWFAQEVLFDHEDQNSDSHDDFPDQVEENFCNTDTEQSDSGDEAVSCNNNNKLPGVKGEAKMAKSILECWQLYFTDDMI